MPKRLPEPPKAPEGLDQDDPQTVVGSGDGTISPTQLNDPACYRSGRANSSTRLTRGRHAPLHARGQNRDTVGEVAAR